MSRVAAHPRSQVRMQGDRVVVVLAINRRQSIGSSASRRVSRCSSSATRSLVRSVEGLASFIVVMASSICGHRDMPKNPGFVTEAMSGSLAWRWVLS